MKRNLNFVKNFLKNHLNVGKLSLPSYCKVKIPNKMLDYEKNGYLSKTVITEVDKQVLRNFSKNYFKSGIIPVALGMNKAGPQSLMGKLLEEEIDLHVNSGLSSLDYVAKTEELCGFMLNLIWDVDPDYESFKVLPSTWFSACGQVANEEANNDDEAMVIFRSLTQLYDYHLAHYLATELGYSKVLRQWTIYYTKEHRGGRHIASKVSSLLPLASDYLLFARSTFANPLGQGNMINSFIQPSGWTIVAMQPWLPFNEIDFVRGSRRVFEIQDNDQVQVWSIVVKSDTKTISKIKYL